MEVVCLPLHGAQAGVLEEEPVCHFVVVACVGWVADFVVRVVLRD